jgi:hypothetical protein
VFSKTQFALMSNTNLLENTSNEFVQVNSRKIYESDEEGKIVFKHQLHTPIFVYDASNGKKLESWSYNNNIIYLN